MSGHRGLSPEGWTVGRRIEAGRSALMLALAALLTDYAGTGRAIGQMLPTAETDRRAPGGTASTLGESPGAGSRPLGNSPGDTDTILLGRPGRSGPRVPNTLTRPAGPFEPQAPSGITNPVRREQAQLPTLGPLALPGERFEEDEGPADGLTLDAAIERLMVSNLDLRTQFIEIPQADADILTASLRANPLFYADANAVPYGSFSPARPGGQTQYDVSITYPFDLSKKRKSRMMVAYRAKRVLEAQYQDAVRLQIDNLYTAYIDVLAARETLRFARAALEGLNQLQSTASQLFRSGTKTEAELNQVRIQRTSAVLQVREAEGGVRRTKRALSVLLNYPLDRADRLELRGTILDVFDEPPPDEQLVEIALNRRPDLIAFRLGIERAHSDVRLAQANKYSDVYFMATPYVFQNNAPFGTKSAHSWSVAVTVPIPVYNRNQGNIQRARLNVTQTQIGLAALEEKVRGEVLEIDQEYDLSKAALAEIREDLLPEASQVRNTALRLYTGGETGVAPYLEAQRDYNEVVRQYRDALVRHRRSMLDLNTALGTRALP
jgi:cobalt-zinc-cadmium efflux system outer membrane protein